MFACLHIRGRVFTVHVRGFLGTEERISKAAAATAYNIPPTSSDQCLWRALCSPAKPEIIAGWASAERPLLENEEEAADDVAVCADAGVAVQVLHVSTRFARSGLLIKRKDPVLDVLLIQENKVEKGVFRRLGVGRIFDSALISELGEVAEEQDIQLV